jgi:hypothetical protein
LSVKESVRSKWNEVLREVTAAHSDVFVNPSSVLNTSTDYANALHPNQRGHDKLAQRWISELSS